MRIYLDVCCLNRPFDDASQPRVAVEAAAVAQIMDLIDSGRMTDYSSEMVEIEIERMPDPDRRRKVSALLPPGERIILLDAPLLDAGDALVARGFALADAVHLAAARRSGVDVFLTVDDKLLKRATRHQKTLALRVTDPVQFLEELQELEEPEDV
jgi:hypothetical protein